MEQKLNCITKIILNRYIYICNMKNDYHRYKNKFKTMIQLSLYFLRMIFNIKNIKKERIRRKTLQYPLNYLLVFSATIKNIMAIDDYEDLYDFSYLDESNLSYYNGNGLKYSSNFRRKNKKWKWLVIILVVILFLVGFYFVRNYISDYIKNENGMVQQESDTVYYAYNKLNKEEKVVYDLLYNAIKSFKNEVSDIQYNFTLEQVRDILYYINIDHPELFWYQSDSLIYHKSDEKIVSKVTFKYCMSQNEAMKRQHQVDAVVKEYISEIDDSMTDYDIALYFYDRIIQSIDYDSISIDNEKMYSLDKTIPDNIRSIYGVFVERKAVCTGYAKALQYLLNINGIECAYIENNDHAWNLVKLDGDYYYIDPTWGDGSNLDETKNITSMTRYDYFCITTKELGKLEAHQLTNNIYLPKCTAIKNNYYYKEKLLLYSYDYKKLKEIIEESLGNGNYYVTFKCNNETIYKEYLDKIKNGFIVNKIIAEINDEKYLNINTGYVYYQNKELNIISLEFNINN